MAAVSNGPVARPVAGTIVETVAKTAGSTVDLEDADADAFSPTEDLAARAGRYASQFAVCTLMAMMIFEIVVRGAFGWSIQWSNEVGGYALVTITFLSLASGQLEHAYHRVHFVESRLSVRANAVLRLLFDATATFVAVVLLFEFVRFEWIAWRSGDVAATSLMTPLWIPRIAMPVGALLLVWALVRTVVGDWHRMRAAGSSGGPQ